ncbi:hypothetical protein AUC45_04365 [Erythrobacter sp. YT30]|nr:hypothetical protein AUC45_04365 [Erythrobacter sp. YT30]
MGVRLIWEEARYNQNKGQNKKGVSAFRSGNALSWSAAVSAAHEALLGRMNYRICLARKLADLSTEP